MPSVRQVIQQAVEQLTGRVEDANVDAQTLATFVLKKDRAWQIAHSDDLFPEHLSDLFNELIESRKTGIPVAHLTGQREFWSLSLRVTPDTLIPRPDTEILVEQALQSDLPEGAQVLDFGTGSGAIALALAKENPGWTVQALDISSAALQVAKENAKVNNISNVTFITSDSLLAYTGYKFDAIVSNPPYIREDDEHLSQGDVRFEPENALVSGADGLDCIRYLIQHAPSYLVPQGLLLVEHGYDQARAVQNLFKQAGYADIETTKDLGGNERVTQARLGGQVRH